MDTKKKFARLVMQAHIDNAESMMYKLFELADSIDTDGAENETAIELRDAVNNAAYGLEVDLSDL
jgi:hypothetical protein